MSFKKIKITLAVATAMLFANLASAAILDFTDMTTPDESIIIDSLSFVEWQSYPGGGHLSMLEPIASKEWTSEIYFSELQTVYGADFHGLRAAGQTNNPDFYSDLLTISAYRYWEGGDEGLLKRVTIDLSSYNDADMETWYNFSFDTPVDNVGVLVFTTNKKSYPSIDNLEVTPSVPVPGALWLLGSGLLGMIAIRKKKQ